MPSSAVPLFVQGAPVVAYARLDRLVESSMGRVAGLAICPDAEGGFYLFGCEAEWNAVTDTWHPALDDALHQAAYEHGEGLRWTWANGAPPVS